MFLRHTRFSVETSESIRNIKSWNQFTYLQGLKEIGDILADQFHGHNYDKK